jgi:hypothetical protein
MIIMIIIIIIIIIIIMMMIIPIDVTPLAKVTDVKELAEKA